MLVNHPPVEIVPNLWMLGTREYPFYLAGGGARATLFEGGIGPTGPILLGQLQELGIAPERIEQLVVTHAHPDHVMAVPQLRRACPHAQVLASASAAKTLGVEKAVAFFSKLDEALSAGLVGAGLVAGDCARPALTEGTIAIDRLLREGDVVATGEGGTFQVLETPGHSDCSLSFHDPQRGVLIISDATGYYLPDSGWCWPNYFSSYGAYVGSIARLAGLDAEVLCLSHNAVIVGRPDVAAYFESVLRQTRAYHGGIVERAQAGASVREIAESLGADVHRRAPLMPLDFFQKNCAILVKQSLQSAGIPAA